MSTIKAELNRSELQTRFDQMLDELEQWRAEHPEASFDEIVEQVTPRRQQLMGAVVDQLACQQGHGEVAEGVNCPHCGGPMRYKGRVSRQVEHLEGETELERAYYSCPGCHRGFFPPRSSTQTDETRLESGHNPTGAPGGSRGGVV